MTFKVSKLPGRREGWAVIDQNGAAVPGTRSTTRREAFEAARELGLTITTKTGDTK